MIIAVVCVFIAAITFITSAVVPDVSAGIAAYGLAAGIFLVAFIVLCILSAIFEIIGLVKGAKDSRWLLLVLLFTILNVIFEILAIVLSSNTVIRAISNSLSGMSQLVTILFFVYAVREMIPDSKAAAKGTAIEYLIIICCVLKMIITICGAAVTSFAAASAIVLIIADILYYILFLLFLNNARKEL